MSRLLITPSSGGTTSPLTTKGDLYTHSTVDARLPVGTDGQFLLSDSTQTAGLKWNTIGTNSLVYGETPSGLVNGSNTSYTIANTPVSGTLMLFRDGQLLVGGGADYTLSGTTITMTTAPVTGSVLLAYYQQGATSTTFAADTVDGYHANPTPTANNIPVLNGIAMLPGTAIPLAQGMLLNGKIVPSVTSNNLTVAIKGLDGNDPSANNPVYVRIGDTVRTITAALSVTKNAGTNWFNSGSAELATKEIDYFVYLGYNATDGVVIGFSRIIGNVYSDFSTTTTNEKYCAISTISNASANDYYELIGRFAATLSAGAGYTWSVPTFTGANLIQRPIYETRWLTWVPTYTGGTIQPTPTAKYKVSQGKCQTLVYASGGYTSNSTGMTITFPFSAAGTLSYLMVNGYQLDNNAGVASAVIGVTNSQPFTVYKDSAGTLWTASNSKMAAPNITYDI